MRVISPLHDHTATLYRMRSFIDILVLEYSVGDCLSDILEVHECLFTVPWIVDCSLYRDLEG